MREINLQISEYVRLNSEKYNRNLSEEEVSRITESYLKVYDNYDEEQLDAFMETIKLIWADEKRSEKDTEDLKNWRSRRRASVISGNITADVHEIKFFKKDNETYEFILGILSEDYVPFSNMTPKQKKKLVDTMVPKIIPANTFLIQEGDSDNRMYIVETGKFLVMKNGEIIKTLERGSFFGEIALLHNVARTATVKSIEDSKIWVVEQKSYMAIRYTDRTRYKKIALEGLKMCKIFQDFTADDLKAIVNVLVFNYYNEGTHITVKGDEIFLFVMDGKIADDDGVLRDVKRYDYVEKPFQCESIIEGTKIKKKQRRRSDHPGI